MMADYRYLLAIYVHAHQTGNSVPPHIDAEARAVLADKPAAPAPPADGEVAELVAALQSQAIRCTCDQLTSGDLRRAAELLQRQALVPVAVSERPWEREGWCDAEGNCWLGRTALGGSTPTWIYGPAAWAERCPKLYRALLPAHDLPRPEVGE